MSRQSMIISTMTRPTMKLFYERDLIFMSKINWWKVASMAMLAASAIMGFGHDLIEDQKTEDELQDMVREEVRKQLAEKDH